MERIARDLLALIRASHLRVTPGGFEGAGVAIFAIVLIIYLLR